MAHGHESVPCPDGAARLDKLLAALPSVGSRSRAREVVESGKVSLDGRTIGVEQLGLPVPAGATFQIAWNRPGTSRLLTRSDRRLSGVGLNILYEDADVVCVDKPPGVLTDTATGKQERERDSVKKRLDEWLAPRNQRAFVCHRIDRDTSGVVVFARNEVAHAKLREAFGNHVPERTYWCAVHGGPVADSGTWEDWMRWDTRILRQVPCVPEAPGAMLARAHWRVLTRGEGATVLEVKLDTGRRNQIRLQACQRGTPLIGERVYLPRSWGQRPQFARQALHAHHVAFPHPVTGKRVEVTAPLAPDLVALVGKLRSR